MNKNMLIKFKVLLTASFIFISACESKKAREDQERIENISMKVEQLLNKEKNDLVENIEIDKINEINELLMEEEKDNLNDENIALLEDVEANFSEIIKMYTFEEKVVKFVEDSEEQMVDEQEFDAIKESLESFNGLIGYYNRLFVKLAVVEVILEKQLAQQAHVELTKTELSKLFNEQGEVIEQITEKQRDHLAEFIKEVENEELKAYFAGELTKIDKKLAELEKARQEEEERRLAEERRLKAEEERKRMEEEKARQIALQREREREKNETNKPTNKEPTNNQNNDTNTPASVVSPTYINGILIANKNYPLPANFSPGESKEARSAFNKMAKAAKESGFNLTAFSTYRSYDYQVELYNKYVQRDGKAAADQYSARPGYSEHQTGLAFDIGDADNPRSYFQESTVSKWLADHAHEYGFILRYPKGKESITGYMYEPWHFRYVGVEIATEIYQSNLTLEEYLGI